MSEDSTQLGSSRAAVAGTVPVRRGFFRDSLPRGLALFLGAFSLLNLAGQLRSARFDANLWWIDVRAFPQPLADGWLLFSAFALVAYALRPPRSGWRRVVTILFVSLLVISSLFNSVVFYDLLLRKAISAALPVPLSLFVAAALAWILLDCCRRAPAANPVPQLWPVFAVSLACLVAFPLAQMLCFGKTDYRRVADVAVVFGARTYADGRPSDALADRVRTACQLYRDGLTHKLLLSGGPGDGPVHETAAMKQLALKLGVRPEDIIVDEAGRNTQATVRNTEAIFADTHASRILVVSHFYHLPRIKMAYQRDGWDVYTVPARESYFLRQMPFFMAREVAALWVYYLRPLNAPPHPGMASG
jgi:vancomycin permeability regulator SanA